MVPRSRPVRQLRYPVWHWVNLRSVVASEQPSDPVDDDMGAVGPTADGDLPGGIHRGDHAVRQELAGAVPVDARVAGPADTRSEHGDESSVLGVGNGQVQH